MEKIGNYKFAETDYKAESRDVLFALQEEFRNEVPALDSDDMKSLAENYSMEQTLDVIKAFGQELSSTHLLYTVEEDSDSYVMVNFYLLDDFVAQHLFGEGLGAVACAWMGQGARPRTGAGGVPG